jgi:hypothetical protein
MVLASAEGVAAITASATLIGAAGLAYVTVHTTRLRLDHERGRQQRELAHSRELADVADLRGLLDEAASALDDAADACRNGSVCLQRSGRGELDQPDLEAALGRMEGGVPSLARLSSRLSVRLGVSDPIALAFGEARESINDVHLLLIALKIGIPIAPTKHVEQESRLGSARQEFFTAAVERAGTLTIGH